MILFSNSLAIMALLGFASAVPELKKRACPATTPQVKPVMASGYSATVVAKGLKTPREMVFDPLGNMLVVNQGGGGVSRITWTDNGGLDVCSVSITQIINDATVCVALDSKLSSLSRTCDL
jgi:glucose/arabinose dehydrogenase